jgi:hypothetical protein
MEKWQKKLTKVEGERRKANYRKEEQEKGEEKVRIKERRNGRKEREEEEKVFKKRDYHFRSY